MNPTTGRNRKNGQAMVELIVGLVAILALFAGMLQLAKLSTAQTDTLSKAREEAGSLAMSTVPLSSDADYIKFWEKGPDDRRYSVDDTHTEGNSAAFVGTVVSKAARDNAAWGVLRSVPRNDILSLQSSPLPASQFGLVDGTESATIPLLPVVKHLLYDADSITVESKVWMPWMKELY
jgi:hypothetical protein